MDQEMRTFFDERLRELTRQIAEETARQFAAAREETAQQIAKLREETIQRFEQNDKRFESLEEDTRHTRILVEDLQSKIQLIAEQYGGLAADLERYHREAVITFEQVKSWIEPYFRDLKCSTSRSGEAG